MKSIIVILILLSISNCVVVNPDFRYKAIAENEFIFPMHSAEYTNSLEDCLRLEKKPCNYPKPQDSLDEFTNTWYSKHLVSLKEFKIYDQKGKGLKMIRFTELGTWSNPFSYKFENNNGIISGTYSKSNGLGGYQAGRRIMFTEIELNQNDWNQIETKIENVRFWQIPTHDPNLVLDGAEWILEILWDDKYHFVTRNSPDVYDGKPYAELCELIINTFNEKNTNSS